MNYFIASRENDDFIVLIQESQAGKYRDRIYLKQFFVQSVGLRIKMTYIIIFTCI